MSHGQYRSSAPDSWTQPRPYSDPTMRYMRYGPVRPMDEPGFFARLFGRG